MSSLSTSETGSQQTYTVTSTPPIVAARSLAPSTAASAAAATVTAGGPSAAEAAPGARLMPKKLSYRMPLEADPHAGTWMSFPHDRFLWREGAAPAQRQMVDIARAISQFEQVWMLADPEVYDTARGFFRHMSGVEVLRVPTNDVWVRDWGPTCLVRDDPTSGRREVAALHFDYNCYGSPLKVKAGKPALMPDWSKDRAAGRFVAQRAGLTAFECPLHLEGGAVHSNGQGTLLVTEECLLHPSRNPQLSRAQVEELLREYLGAERVVWLWKGIVGDEEGTNGHVDNVAAFADPHTVLLAWCDDPGDPAHEVAVRNLAALEEAQRAAAQGPAEEGGSGGAAAGGRPRLRVIKVPCPDPPLRVSAYEVSSLAARAAAQGYHTALAEGVRLAGSYINHYVVNGGVVVPQFGGEQAGSDQAALEVLSQAYPGRKVVGIHSRELLLGGGNIHCLTQQLPLACERPPSAAGARR